MVTHATGRRRVALLALHTKSELVSTMSVIVKLFGRLHDDPIRTRRRQAYEKHQWTKSREAARLWCGGLYEGLSGTRTLVVRDGTSREEVDGAFKRGMPLPVWNQRAPYTTRACWYGS